MYFIIMAICNGTVSFESVFILMKRDSPLYMWYPIMIVHLMSAHVLYFAIMIMKLMIAHGF